MATLLGVLGAGLLDGVLIGVAISIVLLIRRAAHPRVIEIGRVPGTWYFADLARHPENTRIPGVLIARPEGSLLYFNVDHVRNRIGALLAGRETPPRLLVLQLGNVPHIDMFVRSCTLLIHGVSSGATVTETCSPAVTCLMRRGRRSNVWCGSEVVGRNQRYSIS